MPWYLANIHNMLRTIMIILMTGLLNACWSETLDDLDIFIANIPTESPANDLMMPRLSDSVMVVDNTDSRVPDPFDRSRLAWQPIPTMLVEAQSLHTVGTLTYANTRWLLVADQEGIVRRVKDDDQP